ncbi:MAG: hypothetical protein IT338_16300 [Thermomicrobiales bacterium]|nr:hypothetical protein [Thermomicrobiales bacterium]
MSRDEPGIPFGEEGDTTAGGENATGAESARWTAGSGANAITRAGLPNADPDGVAFPDGEPVPNPADLHRPHGFPQSPEERERAAGDEISA